MSYPTFDTTSLPYIIKPISMEQDQTRKFLGYKGLTGDIRFHVEFEAIGGQTSEMQQALYSFWKDDCNYGASPFIISLPFMGYDITKEYVVRFTDKLSSEFHKTWKTKHTLEVVGGFDYIVDDDGNYIIDDAGDYLITDQVGQAEITWE